MKYTILATGNVRIELEDGSTLTLPHTDETAIRLRSALSTRGANKILREFFAKVEA